MNFNQPILQLNGSPYKEGDGELTLSAFIVAAIDKAKAGTNGISDRYALFQLANKVSQDKEVSLSKSEEEMLRKVVSSTDIVQSNLLIGRALEMLDK